MTPALSSLTAIARQPHLRRLARSAGVALVTVATVAPAAQPQAAGRGSLVTTTVHAERTVTADELLRDIRVLPSDRYQGRAPGTRGEDSAVAYISEQFRKIGLKPGNPDGSYLQVVPLVGTTS